MAVRARPLIVALLSMPLAITAFGQPSKSQPITLYRESVQEGNSIVNLVNYNDPKGEWALSHCEELRKLYEAKYRYRYICAPVIDKAFRPDVQWTVKE
ncbi:hypothetical protein [Hydrogenophaga atypica]|uniref:Uncharacterized protein n=1 Tax=Hydrogenophaga atypica TaxID=249409 RepID=A0ABW2QPL8_9BURK